MPLYIMYFNLKEGVSEEEFVDKSKEWLNYVEAETEEEQPTGVLRRRMRPSVEKMGEG